MEKKIAIALCCSLILLCISCASTSVARIDTDSTVDLSGNWNDADIRKAAQDLVSSCLNDSWFEYAGERPIVQVGKFENLSSERIDTSLIVKNVESALISSRTVRFVADKDASAALQEQKMLQHTGTTNEKTAVKTTNATGAGYSLSGTVKITIDTEGNRTIKAYQIDAHITSLDTNEILWSGSSKIKKDVRKASVKF